MLETCGCVPDAVILLDEGIRIGDIRGRKGHPQKKVALIRKDLTQRFC
jgi:hypothetical protein